MAEATHKLHVTMCGPEPQLFLILTNNTRPNHAQQHTNVIPYILVVYMRMPHVMQVQNNVYAREMWKFTSETGKTWLHGSELVSLGL